MRAFNQMTRTPYNAGSLELASNPYGPTASIELDNFVRNNNSINNIGSNSTGTTTINNNIGIGSTRVVGVAAQQQMATQSGANNSARHMSKVLAHSTSLLANDSYIAGMSSDSELTSTTTNRHHHRPYSSQSRVYHAHPAPRSSHASSRVSHYSDSAATYGPSKLPPSSSVGMQQQQQAIQARHNLQHHTPQQQHLSQQGSISSSGSGGSAAYLGLADSPISPMLQQQQRPVASGRQLPHRPFKQSVSIDHHSTGQYHHHQSPHQVGHLTSSPVQASPSLGTRFEQNIYQQHQQQSYPVGLIGTVGQRQLVSAPHSEPRYVGDSGGGKSAAATTGQRDFRFEMDLMEKQAENINLYDENSASAMVVATSAPSAGLSPATQRPTSSSSRQLPPTSNQVPTSNIGSLSVEHLHHQMDHQYHPSAAAELQQQQHQKQFHHKQELYASHQMTSSPADWLPPMGFTGQSHQHGGRSSSGGAGGSGGATSQFKQTMSIDHYTTANQHHHYSPARASNFAEHYRGPLGYASSSPVGGYESPTHHHLHQQQQQQHLAYQSASGDILYHHGSTLSQQDQQQQQQSQQGPFSLSASQLANAGRNLSQDSSTTIRDPSSTQCAPTNYTHHQSPARGANKSSSGQQPKPNLQHQISSSSSNSQSGSLKSNNMDANRNSLVDHQKASSTTLSQFQQQQHHQQQPSPQHHKGSYDYQIQQHQQQQRQHGVLRKGYTSAVTGLTNSNTALNEFTDLPTLAHTPPGGPHGSGGVYLGSHGGDKRSGLRAASPSVAIEAAASSSSGIQQHHSGPSKTECGTRSESSTGLPNGASSNSNSLTKKSNSATQLSMTGTKKRLGFRKKQVTSFSVHRSEEVAPLEARHLVKQGSSVSEGDSSMSGDSSSRSWSNSNFKQQTSDELASMSFIDGLGKGQMISRQGLASPYLGDLQLSLCDRRGNLEIEVIRARNLQAKTNKILPLTYVKLYLVKNRKCLAKAKTTLSNKRTLDPLFQQQLTFHEDYHGCILQSIIWGNFGKMDKKNFMGIAQISIDDLELSDTVISWYKLFLPSSLQTLPSKSLRHTLLSNSTESFTNTNNS